MSLAFYFTRLFRAPDEGGTFRTPTADDDDDDADGEDEAAAPSLIIIPNIQQLARKKASEAIHRPGKYVLLPRNSSWKPCCSHAAWVATQRTRAATPSFGLRRREDWGR